MYSRLKFGSAARFDPLDEEVAEVLPHGGFARFAEIVCINGFPGVLLGEVLERGEKFLIAHDVAQHRQHGSALAAGEGPKLGRVVFQPRGLNYRNRIFRQGAYHLITKLGLHGAFAHGVFGP